MPEGSTGPVDGTRSGQSGADLPHPDDTFESDWLTLREPADHRARSSDLVGAVVAAGASRGWWRVLDLGSGRGSNVRYLRSRLPWARRWTAVDHDAGLLEEVERRVDVEVRTICGDLRVEGLAEIADHDLVTASALLDLVTEEWVEAFARGCATAGAGVLIALTWDGTAEWRDPDPRDRDAMQAVRRHQRGRKGMGIALGPDATEFVTAALRAQGFDVSVAPSPWVLGGARDAGVAEELVRGWVRAAVEVAPDERIRLEEWASRRIGQARSGDFELRVGHHDLLGLPGTVG